MIDSYTPTGALKVKAGATYKQADDFSEAYFITTEAVSISVNNAAMFLAKPYTKIGVVQDATYKFSKTTTLILASA